VGSIAEGTIEADGLIVAPGFIDGHTHMTRRSRGIGWKLLLLHGVTT